MNTDIKLKQLQFYLEKAVEICKELNIGKTLFAFDDLILLDDRAMQKVLNKVDKVELEKSMKTASEELCEKIYSNMSSREVVMTKEDIEWMGPVRKVDVIAAQTSIVGTVEELEDSGEIVILRADADDVIG